MVYTKEEFKRLWEADVNGEAVDGITVDDCADCAVAWGLCSRPKTMPIDVVVRMVCKAAGVELEDEHFMEEREAWRIYNFINDWKAGMFGVCALQAAIDRHLPEYENDNINN